MFGRTRTTDDPRAQQRSRKERAASGRTSERKRGFTAARIIALIVIALGVLGLVYVQLTGGAAGVCPAGAQAGQLKLTSCTYTTEKGNSRADCGTLVVPRIGRTRTRD